MNRTVIGITARAMLGGRRVFLLLAMAILLLALAVLLRLFVDFSDADAAQFLQVVSLSTLLPLFGLIVGTGAIGPEIDDGSIIYLLTKPISRFAIVQSKLVVALGATLAFAVLPTVLAGLIMVGGGSSIAAAFGLGALVAGAVYCVLFMLLAIVTRHAVILGLVYALVWESLVGSFIPGARNLSVQQWALSVTSSVTEPQILTADVGLGVATVLIVGVFAAGTWYAGQRLRVLTLVGEE